MILQRRQDELPLLVLADARAYPAETAGKAVGVQLGLARLTEGGVRVIQRGQHAADHAVLKLDVARYLAEKILLHNVARLR